MVIIIIKTTTTTTTTQITIILIIHIIRHQWKVHLWHWYLPPSCWKYAVHHLVAYQNIERHTHSFVLYALLSVHVLVYEKSNNSVSTEVNVIIRVHCSFTHWHLTVLIFAGSVSDRGTHWERQLPCSMYLFWGDFNDKAYNHCFHDAVDYQFIFVLETTYCHRCHQYYDLYLCILSWQPPFSKNYVWFKIIIMMMLLFKIVAWFFIVILTYFSLRTTRLRVYFYPSSSLDLKLLSKFIQIFARRKNDIRRKFKCWKVKHTDYFAILFNEWFMSDIHLAYLSLQNYFRLHN